VSAPINEEFALSDEIYNHLPKWRRLIHDLAKEAGIKTFAKPSGEEVEETSTASDSSNPGQNKAER
jgi:hypothetical protein